MKLLSKLFLNCSLFALLPVVANAAGTYYTGAYQSPQNRYTQNSYAQRNTNSMYSSQRMPYASNQYSNTGYSSMMRADTYQQNQQQKTMRAQQPKQQDTNVKKGFTLGADFTRQAAMWQFEMKESASILHYDNIDWNVLGVNAGYVFGNKTPVQITAGFQYGMQSGESTMVDDDITNGGFFVAEGVGTDDAGNEIFLGNVIGKALSIGTSKDGSMLGFNAGIGLKDFIKFGKLKVTPSIGWRYLKYELETTNNHGMSMHIFDGKGGCIVVSGTDEIECDGIVYVKVPSKDGNGYTYDVPVRGDTNNDGVIDDYDDVEINVPDGALTLDLSNNFFFNQPSVSHNYEVEWSGPYLALDFVYDVNQNNNVNAFVELGLPSYTAIGDQPYRYDWQHPKSVEDKGDVGSGFHFGAGASWRTAITDNIALSIGVTYDYYTVSDAQATTYMNPEYGGAEYQYAFISLCKMYEIIGG